MRSMRNKTGQLIVANILIGSDINVTQIAHTFHITKVSQG